MNRSPLTGLRPSGTSSDPTGEAPARVKPPPLRAILTRPVLISISSYGMLALLTMAAGALIPLVWSTSVSLGGLGLSPASIGLWMSWYGCMNGVIQYCFFHRLLSRFGPRRVLLISVSMCALIYALFPLENLALRHVSNSPKVAEKLLIMLQLTSFAIAQMGFSKSIPMSVLRDVTDHAWTHQVPYTCTFPLPSPTSDRWVQRMASRGRWRQSNA